MISIIIVNHNGKKFLYNCIKSIINSNFKKFEIIISDNASRDNSIKLIEKKFSKLIKIHKIKIIKNKKNYGPAKARNIAVNYADYEYLNFLDNDTEVDKKWAKEAVKLFKSNSKIGIIQCKLLLKKNKRIIDYVGEYLGSNGFLVQKANGGEVDIGQFEKKEEIMAAKSAGMFIRKKVFKKIGGFDDDYFIYLEETDLGMRSGIAGYKSIYNPKSIVYHMFGGSIESLGKNKMIYNSKFHGSKNYICTLIKNLESTSLLKILPIHIISWLGLACYKITTFKISESLFILKGIIWNIIFLPKTLYKRHYIQKFRKISDRKLFRVWIKKVPFKYFLDKAFVKKRVGMAESF